jgi:hypothetical protein
MLASPCSSTRGKLWAVAFACVALGDRFLKWLHFSTFQALTQSRPVRDYLGHHAWLRPDMMENTSYSLPDGNEQVGLALNVIRGRAPFALQHALPG